MRAKVKFFILGVLVTSLLVYLVGLVVPTEAQNKNLGHVTVNSISVVDADGNITAQVGTGKLGGYLVLYDKNKHKVAEVNIGNGGGYFNMFALNGNRSIYLGTKDDGSGGIACYKGKRQIWGR